MIREGVTERVLSNFVCFSHILKTGNARRVPRVPYFIEKEIFMAIFTNQASLSYNNVTVNSNVATGELQEALSAQKIAVVREYGVNDRITYVFSVVNTGAVTQNGLTLTDDLGAFTESGQTLTPLTYVDGSFKYYVNGVLQPTPAAVTAGPPLTVSGISVPAGGNALLIYEAAVNQYAPLDSGATVVNTATLAENGISATASETVTASEQPNLTISKSITPATVTENSRVTYTFVIQNYGNREVVATDDATVTDLFNPILSDLAVFFNGTPWTEGTDYNYDENTGLFQSVAGQITVPAATYTRDPATGAVTTTPGVSTLTVVGTI